jgi:hypothetical protein
MKRFDVIIIAIVIVISIASAVGFTIVNNARSYDEKVAVISVDGKPYKTVSFDKNQAETIDIKSELGTNIIKIENNKIGVVDADCPDKVCIHDGFVEKPGQMLVCLPNKVVIEIKGQKQAVDDLSY